MGYAGGVPCTSGEVEATELGQGLEHVAQVQGDVLVGKVRFHPAHHPVSEVAQRVVGGVSGAQSS